MKDLITEAITKRLSQALESTGGIASLAKGGGGGNAEAGVRIAIEPAGYLRATANGPQFVAIDPARG